LRVQDCRISAPAAIGHGLRPVAPWEFAMSLDLAVPILVVDDYRTMVRIVRDQLTRLGFTDVDDAANGEEALAKLRARKFGLVISDWNMEPMNGIELLRRVRTEFEEPVRFIMLTADSRTDNVIAARRAGVDTYLVKPFTAQTLKARIEAALAA
jgi:two-component system chemotaxis response regulator CheY